MQHRLATMRTGAVTAPSGARPLVASSRARRGRGLPVGVRCSNQGGCEEEVLFSPGGVKMIGNNRPTSPKAWEVMHKKLCEAKVRAVEDSDIKALQARGAKVIDVRPPTEFVYGYLEDSINVPLYRLIEGFSTQQVLRKAGYAFFGIANGTERNPDFEEEVLRAVPDKDAEIIVLCNTGGTLEESINFKFGKQSRSLMAAYEMVGLGYTKVRFLEGGFMAWDDDIVVEKEKSWIEKTLGM
eukprot:CAMPEP_0197485130 /NCGR_PEP_ID=MMETSP1311-20131121/123_1 /TAXON_ID=464262 /ORGANISM="Genus nov. species nov., Strain RCC856" /LENGTH=239 /DNA_ID=CAMNT_0043027787 /DNA_START=117 /DNA_END=836 /DNA_ORIENTATION=-